MNGQQHTQSTRSKNFFSTFTNSKTQHGFVGLKLLLSLALAIFGVSSFLGWQLHTGNHSTVAINIPAMHLARNSHTTKPATTQTSPDQSGEVLGIATSRTKQPVKTTDQFLTLSQLNQRLDDYTKFLVSFGLTTKTTPTTLPSVVPAQTNFSSGFTGIIQNPNGNSTAVVGGSPIVSYYPAVPSTGFTGTSLAGFGTLSAGSLTSANTTVTGSLTVSGTATFSQPLPVSSGGTGSTTPSGIRTALGLAYANDSDVTNGIYIAAWGDSLTQGGSSPYPAQLSSLLNNRLVYNGGVSGDTSTQIRTRMLPATDKYAYTTIIWAGRNNYSSPTIVKADIAAMVAALGHQRYIILSVINGTAEPSGTANYNTIIQLNSDLAALYPNNYVDIRAYLVSQYNSGVPQDVTDHTNDVPPSSLRADSLHMNAAGYTKVAQRVLTALQAMTNDYQSRILTVGTAFPLYSLVRATTTNLTVGSDAGANITSGTNNVAIGQGALQFATSTSFNTAVGYQALNMSAILTGGNNSGINNSALGYAALRGVTTGSNNTASGHNAMLVNSTGNNNVANGEAALLLNATGNNNIAVGVTALQSNSDGNNSIAIGHGALFNNISTSNNVAVGYYAARGTAAYYNQGSSVLGYQAGYSFATGADYNTLIGLQSGYNITTGTNNILIGAVPTASNANITTGSNNILIGYNISATSSSSTGQLNIGNLIYGTGLTSAGGSTAVAGNVGINTSTPGRTLTVAGDIRATGFLYDSSNSSGTAGMVLQTGGAGYSWVATSTLGISGGSGVSGGTNGYVTRFTSATALSTGLFIDNGTVSGVNATSSSYTFNLQGSAGVAPLNVSSSTGTSLLSVDQRGYVGIGTSATYKLDVNGDVNVAAGQAYRYNGQQMIIASTTFQSYYFGNSGNTTSGGTGNTSLGYIALTSVASGNFNTAVGYSALLFNSNGSNNIAIGTNALQANVSGGTNVAVGVNALYANINSNNTALGYSAGYGSTINQRSVNDSFATFLGYSASRDGNVPSSTALTNITAIGKNAQVGISNAIVLGGTGADAVNVGIGTTTPTSTFFVQGTGAVNPFNVASSTGASLLTVLANGNVGIGTSSPSSIFTVNGSTLLNGAVTINGTCTGSGCSVPTGSAFPTPTQGSYFGFTSYVNVPNTNNAFVWQPGPYYAHNSSNWTPQTLDTLAAGGSITWFGDSLTANYGLVGANNGFVNKATNYIGWTATNAGTSGATCPGGEPAQFLNNPSGMYVYEYGINDLRLNGASVLPDYIACLQAGILWRTAGTLVKGQGITLPTNWATSTAFFLTNMSIQTSTNNAPASFSIAGDTVYVATTYAPSSTAAYTVTIDGRVYGPYTAASIGSYVAGGSVEPYAQRFTGLGKNVHTVTIQKTGGTDPLTVLYVASNSIPQNATQLNQAPKSYLMGVPRMIPGTVGVSGYAYWGGSDALVAQYNTAEQNLAATLGGDGLSVAYVDIGKFYDPNVAGNVQADGLHPTDQGDTAIARAFFYAFTTAISPAERTLIGSISKSFSFSSNSVSTSSTSTLSSFSIQGTAGSDVVDFSSSSGVSLFHIAQNGNVGIGTTTPTSTFFVQGTGAVNPFTVASSTGTALLTVLPSGTVGVGTSTPHYESLVGNTSGIATTSISTAQPVGVQNGLIAFPTLSSVIIGNGTGHAKIAAGTSMADSNDVLIGYQAGYALPSNVNNYHTLIGSNAGANATAGAGSVAVGQKAFVGSLTLQSSVAIGSKAGSAMLDAEADTFVGYAAAQFATSTNIGRRTYLGYGAGQYDNGDFNINIGWNAGPQTYNPTSGSGNVAVGYNALQSLNGGASNIALGYQAGYSLTSGIGNIFMGYQAGFNATAASTNTFIGYQAGYFNTGANNIFLGSSAGGSAPAATSNTFIAGSGSSGGGNRIDNVFFGKGYADASPTDYTINGTGGSGTDIAGANLILAGGKGTGAGAGGSLIFQTAAAGSTGSSLNSLTERMRITNSGNVGIGTSTPTLGPLVMASGAYVTSGGAWTNSSDRNRKENFTPVGAMDILEKINHLSVTRWNYKSENATTTHIGPVAQDFYAAFNVGGSDTSISTIDPAGVALLGIQALDQKITALQGSVSGNATATTLTVYNPSNFSGDSVGEAKILAGVTSVRVNFSQAYSYQPIVTVTQVGINHTEYGVENIEAGGFAIIIDHAVSNDITFNWHSFASPQAKLTVSNGSTTPIQLVIATAPPVSPIVITPPTILSAGQVLGASTTPPSSGTINSATSTPDNSTSTPPTTPTPISTSTPVVINSPITPTFPPVSPTPPVSIPAPAAPAPAPASAPLSTSTVPPAYASSTP